jgi:hypothetical protein
MTGAPKKVRQLTNAQKLVKAFLFDSKNCSWPKEIKIANKLIKDHGFDFLIFLEGRQKMPSLCWFLTDDGKQFLKDVKKYNSMSFEPQKIELAESPIAPVVEIIKKPNSVKEFLNLFNKK